MARDTHPRHLDELSTLLQSLSPQEWEQKLEDYKAELRNHYAEMEEVCAPPDVENTCLGTTLAL